MNKWTLLSCGVLIAFIACNQKILKIKTIILSYKYYI